jgi:hypothetical protein
MLITNYKLPISNKMKHYIILTIILLFTVSACKKKEVIPDPFISATADNYSFFASGKTVSSYKSVMGTYTSLQIEGVMASGASMTLWIKNYSGTLDSLSLDSTTASATYLPVTPSVSVTSVYGKLVIKSVTPALTGNFEYTCTDSTKVKGSFRVIP